MSDFGPPRGIPPTGGEPEQELSADAYEASVPTRLTGFRGTSPAALVLAGGIAVAIVLVSLLTFFFHRPGPNANVNHVASVGQAQPAAPGIGGGGLQTPFIPEVTLAPAGPTPTPEPLIRMPAPVLTAPPAAAPVEPPNFGAAPQNVPAAVAAVPAVSAPLVAAANPGASETEQNRDGRMQIDQPKSNGQSQDAQAAADIGRSSVRYVPIYRNGRVVSVVPQLENSQPNRYATSQSSTAAQQSATGNGAAGTSDAGSGQFVSDNRSGPGLGAGNGGLLEAKRYSRQQDNGRIGYARPQSYRQLDTASVINARLMSKIESDLPGPVIAQVTQPVYDSATHSVVVIPAGSRVFGNYDEETVSTSSRLLLAFDRLIFPDGEEFDIGGQPGTDANGTAGFGGDVDRHRGSLYTSALLLTVLAGAESAITPQTNNSVYGNTSISTQVQSAAGAELSQLGNKILNNAIERPATVIIRPPYAFQIIVTRDFPLDQYAAQR